MRVSVFVAILLIALVTIAGWSLFNGVSWGMVVLRVVVAAVVLQIGYFVMLLLSAVLPWSSASDQQKHDHGTRASTPSTDHAKGSSR
ncbi:hypothetical protein [Qingshengfaniella alkalisoli]|uniref:Exopolysaccharide production repressor protein n=1 Tax=Qingshengfaniella alkalisoli TaxID=2599296 RepID=A0A5B8IZX5_9RHOB|nr:hypothetical protein [Qingshengfaniella alkalisoli]QDY71622.1 hypothetical protein FPZ52_18330 [Qingshengfaniella alkalisoli]